MMTPADLAPLEPGQPTSLSFADDPCIPIERMPQLLAPGACEGMDFARHTVFTEPLRVLRCGLIVPERQLPSYAGTIDPTLADDIARALGLARTLRCASYAGASSSRFAPLLVIPEQPLPRVAASLQQTLGITVAIDARKLEPSTQFATTVGNPQDAILPDGTLGEDDFAPEEQQAEQLAALDAGFAGCRDPVVMHLGLDARGRSVLYHRPVLFVAETPSRRIAGLLTLFVD